MHYNIFCFPLNSIVRSVWKTKSTVYLFCIFGYMIQKPWNQWIKSSFFLKDDVNNTFLKDYVLCRFIFANPMHIKIIWKQTIPQHSKFSALPKDTMMFEISCSKLHCCYECMKLMHALRKRRNTTGEFVRMFIMLHHTVCSWIIIRANLGGTDGQ